MLKFAYSALVLLGLAATTYTLPADSKCKNIPGQPGWPSDSDWKALNTTVCGRLLKPLPPAAPCHKEYPVFDNTTCAAVTKGWLTADFHAQDPISADYNAGTNDSCLPDPSAPCSGAGYPVYVVNATSADDIKAGIKFARKHNIRLVVKGTGHDVLTRSSGPNSLSIWTHYMTDFEYTDNFKPAGCDKALGVGGATVGAGIRMAQLYEQAAAHNVVVIGGAESTVGVGGFLTGGGHGPITGTYGLAADNVLEFEVVTGKGKILVANECQNQDLFWALRGGGGSTYGIFSKVTLQTFPSPQIVSAHFRVNATPNSEPLWDASAYIYSEIPRLVENRVEGYHYMFPNTSEASMPGPTLGQINMNFFLVNSTADHANELIQPLADYLRNSSYGSALNISTDATEFPNFFEAWNATLSPAVVGVEGKMGSRLLDKKSYDLDHDSIKQKLKSMVAPSGFIGHLVSGPGVWNAKPRDGSNSVNPSWRKTYEHMILVVQWLPLNSTSKEQAVDHLEKDLMPVLRSLAPDTGCYINEADPDEPDFGQVFWGPNYGRLVELKEKYDPDSVFYCNACVGHDKWVESNGQLCKI